MAAAAVGALAITVSLAASVPAASRPLKTRAAPQTRYSLVNGCYSLRLTSGQRLGPNRMQATTLAEYQL